MFDLTTVADTIASIALVISLAGACAISVIAYLRPRALFVWIAAGSLAIALMCASALSTPIASGFAPLLTALALAVAVFGGSPAAGTALRLAMGTSVSPGIHGGILIASKPVTDAERQGLVAAPRQEVLRGGLVIGILERIATTGAIVAGFPEAIAIIVAVKGVGRFTELEAAEARERFIIGTLASLIWACAAGLVVHLAAR
ncbi:hypothetical protein BJ978_002302 [Agromyces terreus]|uniref:Uncharacterized protein n=1 Tax=Agromyces terreus TaxID=424795 RepID=A0A9X2H1S6_9MICO|nr:hypothetical protein [Agromyces terreus]MCP2371626.1 hypothetical protein [Agromyces terreus]